MNELDQMFQGLTYVCTKRVKQGQKADEANTQFFSLTHSVLPETPSKAHHFIKCHIISPAKLLENEKYVSELHFYTLYFVPSWLFSLSCVLYSSLSHLFHHRFVCASFLLCWCRLSLILEYVFMLF